jgi:multiple sugar transport system permease protein
MKQKEHKVHKEKRGLPPWTLLTPYGLLFFVFIVIPVVAAVLLSFTYFNTIEPPRFIGLQNYIDLLTTDSTFLKYVIPNTITYALFVGVGGYILSFFLAWSLSQLTHRVRTIMAVIIYSPSLTGGVLIANIWRVIFDGSETGYLNYLLMKFGFITEPITWLQSSDYLMVVMIIVALWSSMGVGFLSILSGITNVDKEIYEAAYMDGVKNRFQEIFYVTIPSIKPQMLFGAIMAIVNTFTTSGVGVDLSGSNPTPNYAGQLIVTHISDFGFIRNEMGYAAAVSVVLLLMIKGMSSAANKLFAEKD